MFDRFQLLWDRQKCSPLQTGFGNAHATEAFLDSRKIAKSLSDKWDTGHLDVKSPCRTVGKLKKNGPWSQVVPARFRQEPFCQARGTSACGPEAVLSPPPGGRSCLLLACFALAPSAGAGVAGAQAS